MSSLSGNLVTQLPTDFAGEQPRKPEVPKPIAVIDGTAINIGHQPELIDQIIASALAGVGGTVFTLNLDHLVKLERDSAFRHAKDNAAYVTADGAPLVWMARRQNADIVRVTGADLVRPLCAAAANAGVPVHFFGTRNDVLLQSALILARENPGLRFAGLEAPPYGFSPFGTEARAAATRIAVSGARICFVALGAPKQETFAAFARQWAPNVTFVCIGAALDFIGGGEHRAPRAMQKYGLEWLWRLANDPKRLFKRYVLSALYLFRYVARSTGRSLARKLGIGKRAP